MSDETHLPARSIPIEQKLADTERALVELVSASRVIDVLTRKYDVDPRTVEEWMRRVRQRWAELRKVVTPEDRRAQLVSMAETVFASALNNTELVRDAEGNPVMEPTRDAMGRVQLDGEGNPVMRPLEKRRPDRKNALAAARLLSDLDGVAVNRPQVAIAVAIVHADLEKLPEPELAELAGVDAVALERAVSRGLPAPIEEEGSTDPSTNGHSNGHN